MDKFIYNNLLPSVMADTIEKIIYPIPSVALDGSGDASADGSAISALRGSKADYRGHDTEAAISQILLSLSQKETLSRADKNWFTEKIKELRTAGRNNKVLDAVIHDDEFFYKLLFIGGVGITVLGAALGIVLPTSMGDTALGGDIGFAGLILIAGGITVSVFAAAMLAIPRVFGPDGIQFEVEGGLSITGGAEGSLKIG